MAPTEQKLLLLLSVLLLVWGPSAVCSYPQPSGASGPPDCKKICDSSDHSNYRPQECTNRCPPGFEALVKNVDGLQMKINGLQAKTNSLMIMLILLFVVVLLLIPAMIYRTTLNKLICGSSNYNKQQQQQKKKNSGGRRSRRGGSGAPTGRPGQDGIAPLAGQQIKTEGTEDASATVIANGPAVRMAALVKEEVATMIPNPEADNSNCSSTEIKTKRNRHPSESSCTAEAGISPPYSNPCSSYYNYGCSTSTLAISPTQSRTSHLSRYSATPMPLNASNLLNQSDSKQSCVNGTLDLTDSSTATNAGAKQSPGVASNNNSAAYLVNDSPYFHCNSSRDQTKGGRPVTGRSISRRPSSPDSPTDGTTLSNVTMATTLSSATITSDI